MGIEDQLCRSDPEIEQAIRRVVRTGSAVALFFRSSWIWEDCVGQVVELLHVLHGAASLHHPQLQLLVLVTALSDRREVELCGSLATVLHVADCSRLSSSSHRPCCEGRKSAAPRSACSIRSLPWRECAGGSSHSRRTASSPLRNRRSAAPCSGGRKASRWPRPPGIEHMGATREDTSIDGVTLIGGFCGIRRHTLAGGIVVHGHIFELNSRCNLMLR